MTVVWIIIGSLIGTVFILYMLAARWMSIKRQQEFERIERWVEEHRTFNVACALCHHIQDFMPEDRICPECETPSLFTPEDLLSKDFAKRYSPAVIDRIFKSEKLFVGWIGEGKMQQFDPGRCWYVQAYGLKVCEQCPFDYEGPPEICGGKSIQKAILEGTFPVEGIEVAREAIKGIEEAKEAIKK